ncbi:WD40-repeat-containing domain protein, partial [Tylopilus felleus]
MVNADKGAQPIIVCSPDYIYSVTFLADGKHFVSGDQEGKIRTWRMQDGKEVGTPMDAGSIISDIAVSRDGKWIVSGMDNGLVIVWNAKSHEKFTQFKHTDCVDAVDVSPDGTKIASGSDDKTACVWSLSTGQRLLDPLKHDDWVVGAKFSPDGRLIATATWKRNSVRVYDSQNGHLLVDVPIQVNSALNQSLAWAIDGKQLFALSHDGNIHCLDPSRGTTLSKWPIHSSKNVTCIALESTSTL